MREEWVTIDPNLRLHVLHWDGRDTAPPFVLVHGLASNAWMWAGAAEVLAARGHEVVAVDLRGHGRSSKPADGYDTATAADDLAALIRRLGLDRPVVAGQSWGGNIVLDLASRRRNPARAVVCVDGGWIEPSSQYPDWDECARRLAPPLLAGAQADAVEQMLRLRHPDWSAVATVATMANFERQSDGTVRPWLSRERHLRILRDLWERHPPAQYPDIGVPVLLLPVDTGEGWMAHVREEVAKAEVLLARARTVWLEGDHDAHAQQPETVAGVIAAACEDGFLA